jgi:hypothetical protein
MHLLVIEDDERLGRVLKRLLEEDRHVVDLAVDGGPASISPRPMASMPSSSTSACRTSRGSRSPGASGSAAPRRRS